MKFQPVSIHLSSALLWAMPLVAFCLLPAAAQDVPREISRPVALTDAKASEGPTTATAPSNPQDRGALNRVEVTGNNSDNEQRRASSASRIIIGKEEIERYGDSSVSEVLKRLPGVTTGGRPGRGGDVRMRGMGGGYTQILLNGERMPPGFSLDSLPPEQLERIEIMRAPTAEFGARAIAGTINIVLKEALRKTANELRAGLGLEGTQWSPSVSWTRNDTLGAGLPYTATLSVNQSNTQDDNLSRIQWRDRTTDAMLLDQTNNGATENHRDGLNFNARVQLPLGAGESVTLMPIAIVSSGNSSSNGRVVQLPGGILPLSFADSNTEGTGSFRMLRNHAQWQKRVDDATRIEARLNLGTSRSDNQSTRRESNPLAALTRTTLDTSSTRESSWSLNAKASHQMENDHSLVTGLELDQSVRTQSRTTLQDGAPILTEFGDDLNASSRRMAAYVQDEWSISKQLSAYAGLRFETIGTQSDGASYDVSNTSRVLTPLLHATWKPDAARRNQWRSSLTRSYKAASLQELIARPSISQRFPSGTNEISSPDRAGNPGLNPELASGFELAYEHYLEKGGLLSANLFYRRINDLIRNVVAQERVSWSDQPRWVSRPQNVGNATAQGLELEAKVRLDELIDGALPVALRTNISFFDSRVEQVPGPNNRLEGQPTGTANIGADYKLRSQPLSFGFNLNFTPPYALQLSETQSSTASAKVVADAFVLWSVNRETQIRFSANNFAPRDLLNTSIALNDTQRQETESFSNSRTNWSVRLELKL